MTYVPEAPLFLGAFVSGPGSVRYLLICTNGHMERSERNLGQDERRTCATCGAEVSWSYAQTPRFRTGRP